MAHFVLEYSDNLAKDEVSIQGLFADLHEAAEQTRLFPLKGVRSRAYCCGDYRLANGDSEHAFVHLEVKLGVGRSLEERQMAAELFFTVLCDHFASQISQRGIAISFEMKELEPVLKFNKNNIQDYMPC